jgi:predicted nucleic acid-binding protein
MILVDTSIWVDHFRNGNARLSDLLNDQQVLMHPFIIGELSLGLLKNRLQIMDLLSKLPLAPVVEHEEVMATVVKHRLSGTGIGWVDAHLIASALLGDAKLLTADKPLLKATQVTGVSAS